MVAVSGPVGPGARELDDSLEDSGLERAPEAHLPQQFRVRLATAQLAEFQIVREGGVVIAL